MLSQLSVRNQARNQNALRNWMSIIAARSSSHVAVKKDSKEILAQNLDNPGFLKKLYMRLHGIPLKGEAQAPVSQWFHDAGKFFSPSEQLPSIPKDFKESPERDLVNYPHPELHMFPPKTRMLIIPDSWLTPFHKVTGASGPYIFIGSVVCFFLNKEWVVFDENFMKLQVLVMIYFFLSQSFGYRIHQKSYELFTEYVNELKQIVNSELKDAVEFRKTSAAESQSLKAMQDKFPIIFKENLDMQLEAAYRKNVDAVANELKRRIDYLQEVEATKMRFERDILLKSIIQGVYDQISKNEGNIKDSFLDNCISQLKSIPA